ncbi:hypothetical protein [Acanthopleuribacter pedis]|uniref:Uncharacterized protein n=1 Tax=Acanthopleuribacter pedis TaxID=442870 RepID=A0A8J7Q9A9_9BACT|nr:hypothetical protein [Acanthopleuribacter pedis]MBO1321001.1 hypothetical protein [Acanthopleuribacter pedis]
MKWNLAKDLLTRPWWGGLGVLLGTLVGLLSLGVTLYIYMNPYEVPPSEIKPPVSRDGSSQNRPSLSVKAKKPLGQKPWLETTGDAGTPLPNEAGCEVISLNAGTPKVFEDLSVILHFNPERNSGAFTYPLVAVCQKTGVSRTVPLLGVGDDVSIELGNMQLKGSVFSYDPQAIKLCLLRK